MSRHGFHINITERCNLHCIHCYQKKCHVMPDPSPAMIEEILKKFKKFGESCGEYGRHNLTIGGGEPLVRDDLEDIILMAGHMGFLVRVATNGTIIDRKRAKSLKKSGLTFVQVSLDGACEATYEKIRGKGTWSDPLPRMRLSAGRRQP